MYIKNHGKIYTTKYIYDIKWALGCITPLAWHEFACSSCPGLGCMYTIIPGPGWSGVRVEDDIAFQFESAKEILWVAVYRIP